MHACLRLQSSCECTSCWKLVAINTQLSITLATVVAEDDIVLTMGNKEHDIIVHEIIVITLEMHRLVMFRSGICSIVTPFV